MVWGGWCVCALERTHLANYEVGEDGTDGCQVCFTAREFAIGGMAHRLDGCLLRIKEVFLPDSENSSVRVLYHCNRGYAYAEVVDDLQLKKVSICVKLNSKLICFLFQFNSASHY